MENPLSLRLLYLLTRISYWGLIVLIAIVAFAGIIMLTLDPELMKLGLSSSLSITEEVVYLNGGKNIPVQVSFSAASIEVPVKHLDRLTTSYPLLIALMWLSCLMLIMRFFMHFMRRVLDGQTFHAESILLIKQAAWGFLILEAIEFLAASIGYFYVQQNFDLGDLEHAFSWSFPSTALILSLTLWALAHIFQKGKELEDEQKLTV
ncbi:MAG: DUF2975 domain-containing protein [Bacteroidota bacterium]